MYKTNFPRLRAYPLVPEKTVRIGDTGQYAKKNGRQMGRFPFR